MLADACTETRVSEIADFVMQRWEYNSDQYHPDPCHHWEEYDSIDSWDEDSSTEPIRFCGYDVDEGLVERVYDMVEEALEEHKEAMRFYGVDPQARKVEFCHCGGLRRIATSPAETKLADRYLMLVRDPPPWRSVYGPNAPPPRRARLAAKPSLSNSSNLSLDRSSTRARKSTQEMLGMIAQRRSLPAAATPSSPALTLTVSKNPFRKDPNTALARGRLGDRHRAHGNSARDEYPDPAPDNRTPKRMKSIFQIPVPPRPTPPTKSQSQRVIVGSGIAPKKPGKLKQTTLSETFGKRT